MQEIGKYIENLPDARSDEDLLVDSRSVLRDIVAQHGLLTERATGIYSFSHLTFHEYFVARSIVDISNPVKYEAALSLLMEHVADKRWREVFLLVVERSDDAGYVLSWMKRKIDEMLASDQSLQKFLVWVNTKATEIDVPHRLTAVRAFYFEIELKKTYDNQKRQKRQKRAQAYYQKRSQAYRKQSLVFFFTLNSSINKAPDISIDQALHQARILAHYQGSINTYNHSFNQVLDSCLNQALDQIVIQGWLDAGLLDSCLDPDLNQTFNDLVLYQELKNLSNELSDRDGDRKGSIQWWISNGTDWIEKINQLMIGHRNIGHDWQFSESQKELLQKYYDANALLVDCLKSECYANRQVLQHIEDTLLLPLEN